MGYQSNSQTAFIISLSVFFVCPDQDLIKLLHYIIIIDYYQYYYTSTHLKATIMLSYENFKTLVKVVNRGLPGKFHREPTYICNG